MVRFRVETIAMDGDLTIEAEKEFLSKSVAWFRTLGADIIIPSSTNAVFRTYPQGAEAAPYGTLVIDLRRTEEDLWNRVHSKHKNVIRNAMKKGVRIITGPEHAGSAYDLVRETFQRSSMSFMSKSDLLRIVANLGPKVRVMLAEADGRLQGCAIIPFSQHTAYYVYGGTADNPVTGATNLLQWEAIRQFRAVGVHWYDFCGVRIAPEEGSKAESLMKYKERFGSELRQGFLWKYSIRSLTAAVYSLSVKWLRGGDIVDMEKHKLATSAA
jgi:lipid II:glycine glycyltransferase (peptidoglycan interpeptide bridge formation enzyme)